MIYDFEISTPANTARTAPVETTLELTPGVIHKLDILFPPGPAGLLHMVIMRELTQLWPSNPDGNFASDDEVISYPEYYDLLEAPHELQAVTWNEDDTYDHIVHVRFGILESWQLGIEGRRRSSLINIEQLQLEMNQGV